MVTTSRSIQYMDYFNVHSRRFVIIMSTSLDIYPFQPISFFDICRNIEAYFMKLTGLPKCEIIASLRYAEDPTYIHPAKVGDLMIFDQDVTYIFSENIYVNIGVYLSIIEAGSIVEDSESYPSSLIVLPDLRLKVNANLLFATIVALGIAKSMGNKYIYHDGDFGWTAGLYSNSMHSQKNGDESYKGYTAEYDLPLDVIDGLPNAQKTETLDDAVLNFFSDKNISF